MPTIAAAIIPAAGSGKRMKLNHPKQYHLLSGLPILIHTINAFLATPAISQVVVVAPPDMVEETNKLLLDHGITSPKTIVTAGGIRRQDSVYLGLQQLHDQTDIVLVHDGARPLVQPNLIEKCLHASTEHGAAIAAVPVKDTIKKRTTNNIVEKTVDRTDLWHAQTPQAVSVSLLHKAYLLNGEDDVTDESSLLEKAKIPVVLVEGAETNIKITRPEDLQIAETILQKSMKPQIKIGHGFDAHQFAPNRKLILGGVTIPYELGLAGHSDAAVLTHAFCDAILGALGLGDIGKHFPDSAEEFKDIYSITLLEKVVEQAQTLGYVVSNADLTVICQAPKLAPFIQEMNAVLTKACKISGEQLNIKATTTEKMGYTGRKEGISAHAVVLLSLST